MHGLFRLLAVSVFVVTGCTTSVKPAAELPTNQVMPVEKRKAEISTVSSWNISGAMAAKGNKKAFSAAIHWNQQGASNYQIRLLGPLGGGAAIIKKNGNVVTYQENDKIITSNSADELLQKQTGIRLPVNSLYYWVRGLPAPGDVQSIKHDQFNHTTQIKQAGFTVNFNRFTSVNQIDLPSSIRLEGNGVMVKLVIKSWKLG